MAARPALFTTMLNTLLANHAHDTCMLDRVSWLETFISSTAEPRRAMHRQEWLGQHEDEEPVTCLFKVGL